MGPKKGNHMHITHFSAPIHRSLLTLKRAVPGTPIIVSVIFNLFIGLPAHLRPWALKRALHMLTTHIPATYTSPTDDYEESRFFNS
jgi:hypothetical protein